MSQRIINISIILLLIHTSLLFTTKIISLGESCTIAGALRNLNIRTEAYPFDWTVTPFHSLYNCINDDFAHFFEIESLKERHDRCGVVDYYGIEFLHDLPTSKTTTEEIGEGVIGQGILRNDWRDHVNTVRQKYVRRINRLRCLLQSEEKIYVVRHFNTSKEQAIQLRDLLQSKYPDADITIIVVNNSNDMKYDWNIPNIRNFYMDVSKVWNNPPRWQEIFNELGIE